MARVSAVVGSAVVFLLIGCGTATAAVTITVPCTGTGGGAHGLDVAIATANTKSGANQIVLASRCTYLFATPDNDWYGPNAITPVASDVPPSDPPSTITVVGNGATLKRASTAPPFRFFFIGADPTVLRTHFWTNPGKGDLTLRDLTLTGGVAVGGSSNGGGGGLGAGGAIYDQGKLTLTRVTLSGNGARGGAAGVAGLANGGGGIGNDAGVDGTGGGFGPLFAGGIGGAGGTCGAPVGHGTGGAGLAGEPGTCQAGGGGGTFGNGDGGTGAGSSTLTNRVGGDGSGGGGDATGSSNGGGVGGAFGFGGSRGGLLAGGGGGGAGGGGGEGGNSGDGGGGGFAAGGGGGGGGYVNSDGGFGGGGGFGAGGGGGGAGGGHSMGNTTPTNGGDGGPGGFGGGDGGAGTPGVGSGGSGAGGGPGGGAGMGGAIFDHGGTVSITNSTLTANAAVGGAGAGNGRAGKGLGGAVFALNGTVTITDGTLDANVADGGGAVYVAGYDGNINPDPASLTLVDSVLADTLDAATAVQPDLVAAAPSLVANGQPNQDSAAATATAPNLVMRSATVGAGTVTGSPITAAPHFRPLAFSGGPGMKTLVPSPGSPVLDAGAAAPGAPQTDERGASRPPSGPTDLGAIQVSGAPATTIRVTAPRAGATYAESARVASSYRCSAPTGVSVRSCSGPVASGSPFATSKLGSHTFTVKATDGDGRAVTKGVHYIVIAPPAKPQLKSTIDAANHKARFSFSATRARGYRCVLLKTKHGKTQTRKPRFARCKSPTTYKKLKSGHYIFEVRGVSMGIAGRAAKVKFAI